MFWFWHCLGALVLQLHCVSQPITNLLGSKCTLYGFIIATVKRWQEIIWHDAVEDTVAPTQEISFESLTGFLCRLLIKKCFQHILQQNACSQHQMFLMLLSHFSFSVCFYTHSESVGIKTVINPLFPKGHSDVMQSPKFAKKHPSVFCRIVGGKLSETMSELKKKMSGWQMLTAREDDSDLFSRLTGEFWSPMQMWF